MVSTQAWAVHLLRIAAVLMASVGLSLGLSAVYGQTIRGSDAALPPQERELVDRINAIRADASCPAVRVDAALVAEAQAHADDMVDRGYLSVVSPEDQGPSTRARAFGYKGRVTESYAAGLSTPKEVADQWTNSANPAAAQVSQRIKNCHLVSIGIGHDTGTPLPTLAAQVWVMALGDT